MIYNCIIVDDEPTARNIIKRYVAHIDYLNLVAECNNAVDALAIINRQAVDIIFLDIEMPILSGLNFLKSMAQIPHVIITTAFREFAIEGFELNVRDYLLKPISFERFLIAINKISDLDVSKNVKDENEFTYFKSGKKNIQVYYNEILFVEGLGNYVKIHTSDNVIVTYERLTDILNVLPAKNFIRIHKSYLVALNKITVYGTDFIEIGAHQLTIGKTYRKKFHSTIYRHE